MSTLLPDLTVHVLIHDQGRVPRSGFGSIHKRIMPMATTQRGRGTHQHTASQGASNTKTTASVASLGVQARLVRVDPDRVSDLAELITACESLRQQWDRLLLRLINRLQGEVRDDYVDRRPDPQSQD